MQKAYSSWKIASNNDFNFYRMLNSNLYSIFYDGTTLAKEQLKQIETLSDYQLYVSEITSVGDKQGLILLPCAKDTEIGPIDVNTLRQQFVTSFVDTTDYLDISQQNEILKFERLLRHVFDLPYPGIGIYPHKVDQFYQPKIEKNDSVYSGARKNLWTSLNEPAFSATERADANILLKVTRASICQSDRRVLKCAKDNVFAQQKIILGHEGGGYIVDPGPWQDILYSGQKALVLPHLTCNECEYCLSYQPNLCRQLQHLGFHLDGCLAEYTALPRQCLFPLPNDFEEDAMPLVEPLACVLRALFKLSVPLEKLNAQKIDAPFVIYGAGPIGALFSLSIKKYWPHIKTCLVDISPGRLEVARNLQIADDYQVSPPLNHPIGVVANSYFTSYLQAFNAVANNGYLILFSGINTKEIKTDETKSLSRYIERLHRYGHHALYSNEIGNTIMLVGSSGYDREDIAFSATVLRENYTDYYQKVQTGIVDGLAADAITNRSTGKTHQLKAVVPTLLSPTTLSSGSHEGIVENNLKVLIKV